MTDVWVDARFENDEFIDGYYTNESKGEVKETMSAPEDKVVESASEKVVAEARAVDDARETVSKEYADRIRREKAAAETELKVLQAKIEEAERKKLAEEKEFSKLAQMEREKREASEKEFTEKIAATNKRVARAELKAYAIQAGITDVDFIAFADESLVTVDADGNVTGAKEAIESLKVKKPHFFAEPKSEKEVVKPRPSSPKSNDAPTEHIAGYDKDAYKIPDDKWQDAWKKLGKVQTA